MCSGSLMPYWEDNVWTIKTRVSLLIFALAVSAGAYVLNGPKWAVKQVPYYINPMNQDLSNADAIASIQAGAAAWSTQSNANIAYVYAGPTNASSIIQNGINEVMFRNE